MTVILTEAVRLHEEVQPQRGENTNQENGSCPSP